jgi:hypothetical protein
MNWRSIARIKLGTVIINGLPCGTNHHPLPITPARFRCLKRSLPARVFDDKLSAVKPRSWTASAKLNFRRL